MQMNTMRKLQKQPNHGWLMIGLWLLLMSIGSVGASESVEKAITALAFSSLSGNQIQIELELSHVTSKPKIFQTDNPARIALDFVGVKSHLAKKVFQINQGAAGTVYVVEASGRTRVVINLTETVPYQTKLQGNQFSITLKPVSAADPVRLSIKEEKIDRLVSNLLPEQKIQHIDFRRGSKGEGRLLLKLSSPNTLVDVKEVGGKVVLNFLNTKLTDALSKRFDVSDFATPVQYIDAKTVGAGVKIIITPVNGNYDYSSYQSDGLLTVDFLPLTAAEKEKILKQRFAYTGKKLTFNFQDIEVRAVLQILADFTGLNIIAADSVEGTVTLRLNDVPWDQALDLILKSKGLAKRKTGNVVLVAPTSEIIKIEEKELAANKIVEQLEPLRTEYIQINYAKAADIQMLLTGSNVIRASDTRASSQALNAKSGSSGGGASSGSSGSQSSNNSKQKNSTPRGVLSARGSSTVDARTNTVIVKDTVKQLEEVRKLIKILDIPVRQVLIESRIVIAVKDFAQELGVRFGVAKAANIGSNKTFAVGAGKQQTFGALMPDANGSTVTVPDGPGYLVDLGANAIKSHPVGALGMTLARAADYVLNLELSALENENRGEILANPRVMTSNRETGYIKQGVQIPFQANSQNSGPSIKFIDAVLMLNVTPQITPDGDVIMDLLITKNAANSAGGIDKREIETTVRVRDGETIVLGGVYEGNTAKDVYKIPFFGDLPGLSWLFRKNVQSNSKQELLIFVTPKIVKSTLTTQ